MTINSVLEIPLDQLIAGLRAGVWAVAVIFAIMFIAAYHWGKPK